MKPVRRNVCGEDIGVTVVGPVAIIIYLVSALIGLYLSYLIIRAAVRSGLNDHYRTVRWYEKTGQWISGSTRSKPPRDFDAGPV
jgi:hypothetical protein